MKIKSRFKKDIEELFADDLRDKPFLHDLWSALTNVDWNNEKEGCYGEGFCFREAGYYISDISGQGNYLTWYCASEDGVVSEYISERMATRGRSYEILK